MRNRLAMIFVASPRLFALLNKIGGIYARSSECGAGRVLVGWGGRSAGKNFGRSRDLGVAIWVDEGAAIDATRIGRNGGFLRFLPGHPGAVAWSPSHGHGQDVENAAFSVGGRLITNLQSGAIGAIGAGAVDRGGCGGRGRATPQPPAFVLSYPRSARQSQPARRFPADRPLTILKDRAWPMREVSRAPVGSGVRDGAWLQPIRRESAKNLGGAVGQGAMAAVLAQGGNASAKLGGGWYRVNRP